MHLSPHYLKKVEVLSANLLSKMSIAVILKPTEETIILQMSNSSPLSWLRAQAGGGGAWGYAEGHSSQADWLEQTWWGQCNLRVLHFNRIHGAREIHAEACKKRFESRVNISIRWCSTWWGTGTNIRLKTNELDSIGHFFFERLIEQIRFSVYQHTCHSGHKPTMGNTHHHIYSRGTWLQK